MRSAVRARRPSCQEAARTHHERLNREDLVQQTVRLPPRALSGVRTALLRYGVIPVRRTGRNGTVAVPVFPPAGSDG